MKRCISTKSVPFPIHALTSLLLLAGLLFAWSAEATAPRIAPKMLGETRQVDIVGYYSVQDAQTVAEEGKLTGDLLDAAFEAGGMQPYIDVLPSKQIAKYEFVVNQVPALIAAAADLSAKEKKRYRTITYYLRDIAQGQDPVLLAFDLKNPRGNKLYKAFRLGLQRIIANGRYLELMEKHLGKDRVPSVYLDQLKRHNKGWK